jgi:hypothetical protein
VLKLKKSIRYNKFIELLVSNRTYILTTPTALLLAISFIVIISSGLYFSALKQSFMADDYIFLSQLRFKHIDFWSSFVYFGRDWDMHYLHFYRPLVRVAWAGQYVLFGENPVGWHLVSLCLYALNTTLIGWLTWLLTRQLGTVVLAGLFFSLHPTHVEPVYWVADQSDLAAMSFCLASLIAYIRFRQTQTKRLRFYIIMLSCFGLGLFCKESSASFFAVPALYDLLYPPASSRRIFERLKAYVWQGLKWYWPLLTIMAVYTGLRLIIFKGWLGGYEMDFETHPFDLAQFLISYSRWLLRPIYFADWLGWLLFGIVVAGLIASTVLRERRAIKNGEVDSTSLAFGRTRALFFGLGWAVLFLLPTVTTFFSVRLTYPATIGMAVAQAALLSNVLDWQRLKSMTMTRLDSRKVFVRQSRELGLGLLKICSIILIIVLSYLNIRELKGAWTDRSHLHREVFSEIKRQIPNPPNYAIFYFKDLPAHWDNDLPPPFLGGFTEAVQMTYNNNTLEARARYDFPIVENRLNQAYFFEYRDGQLVERPDILHFLQKRNAALKNDAEVVARGWNFLNRQEKIVPAVIKTLAATSSPHEWSYFNGKGGSAGQIAAGQPLRVELPQGGILRLPMIGIPAYKFANLNLKLRVGTTKTTTVPLIVHFLVKEGDTTIERSVATLPITADGQSHIYRVKPRATDPPFFYDDQIETILIEIPDDLGPLYFESIEVMEYSSFP